MIPSRRRKYHKKLKTPVVVFSGGSTEDIYFEHLSPIKEEISLDRQCCGSDPAKVLSHAIQYRQNKQRLLGIKNLEVWIVIDKDHFDIDTVEQEASKNGINVAYSNVCFELWYVLHFKYSTAINTAEQWQTIFIKQASLPKYLKTQDYHTILNPRVQTAIKNAKHLEKFQQDKKKPSQKNPYTSVYKLVERIIK